MKVSEQAEYVFDGLELIYAFKVGFEWFNAEFFDPVCISRRAVKVPDLLGRGIGLDHAGKRGIEDFVDQIPISFLQFSEGSPARFISRNRIIFYPVARGVMV